MIIWAKITTQFEGFHCWPTAPDEVSFLRDKHRHIFHVTVWIEQSHVERDVEYVLFKRWVEYLISTTVWHLEASCESIARTILIATRHKYPHSRICRRRVRVEVTEDGENGAVVEEMYD